MNDSQPHTPVARQCLYCCAFVIALNFSLIGGGAHIIAPKATVKLESAVREACQKAKKNVLGVEVSVTSKCRKNVYGTQSYKDTQAHIMWIGEVGLLVFLVAGTLTGVFGFLALRRKRKA